MFSTSSTVNVPTSSGARSKRSATRLSLGDKIARPVVGMDFVVGVSSVEHGVEQLLFGLEVMQQAGGRDARFLRDQSQGRVAPAIARQQAFGDGQNPLPTVLTLGEKRGIWPGAEAPEAPEAPEAEVTESS